jgi:SAM-dependent methyltransferase
MSDEGCQKVGFVGQPVSIEVGTGNPEVFKYTKLWSVPEYRAIAPGEEYVETFLREAKPRQGAHVVDLGCGTGRAGLRLATVGRCNVTMIDFARNCLDKHVQDLLEKGMIASEDQEPVKISFIKADLEKRLPVIAEYGFCCDVMEHIPPEKVQAVLNNILLACRHCFFVIFTKEDNCGKAHIGEPIHLSLHPYSWWLERFNERECVIHWSAERENAVVFYVTAWQEAKTIVESGVVNTGEDQIRKNVETNIAGDWMQVSPHESNEEEVMILGGGPSLANFEQDIWLKRREGVKLITLGGAYNWALEKGFRISGTIIVDARPFNARFVKPVVDDCKYFIASQCDPSVFEGLPKDRTYIWHTMADQITDLLKARYDRWWSIPGGSTVLLRAIPLLRLLGFHRFHLYGCDSCLSGGTTHHAYEQVENNTEAILPVLTSDGRLFHCHPWMVAQSEEFLELVKFFGDEIDLAIYGDGLLSHLITTAANLTPDTEGNDNGSGNLESIQQG